jgi:antitoxin ParD1/3/4
MTTRNVNLTDAFNRFIDEQIEGGRFADASEVVRAGLALLQRQEQEEALKLQALKRFAHDRFGALEAARGVTLDAHGVSSLLDGLEAEALAEVSRRQ